MTYLHRVMLGTVGMGFLWISFGEVTGVFHIRISLETVPSSKLVVAP